MQNILFCAYHYQFLHSAYTLYSYMAQPYMFISDTSQNVILTSTSAQFIFKMHNIWSKLEVPNNTVLLHFSEIYLTKFDTRTLTQFQILLTGLTSGKGEDTGSTTHHHTITATNPI